MTTAAEVISKIAIAGTDEVIDPVIEDEKINVQATMARVKETVARLESTFCYSVRVEGRSIGKPELLPGLSLEKARVIFGELLNAAEDTKGTFRSGVRYQSFGVYQKVEGKWEPIPAFQYRAKSRQKERHVKPRWVK
jgi:hypothetical protein